MGLDPVHSTLWLVTAVWRTSKPDREAGYSTSCSTTSPAARRHPVCAHRSDRTDARLLLSQNGPVTSVR